MPSRIEQAIRRGAAEGNAALIPYVVAGDPNLEATGEILKGLEAAGASVIELGIPFSDPIADGPVLQRAFSRALSGGATLEAILEAVRSWRADGFSTPLLSMSYVNPVLALGWEDFAARAKDAGIDGALLVDLPPEEAAPWVEAARTEDLDTIFLSAPTTGAARLETILDLTRGFLYCVSRLGVTGKGSLDEKAVEQALAGLRERSPRPVALGFGISTPTDAARWRDHADALVIGSALVRELEGAGKDFRRIAERFARERLETMRGKACSS